MKKILLLFALTSSLFFQTAPAAEEPLRTWTVEGKPIEGRMANSNANAVVIVDPDGKRIPTGKKKLSPDDLKYVEAVEASRSGTAKPPTSEIPSPAKPATSSQPDSATKPSAPAPETKSDGREWADAGAKFDSASILKDLPPGYTHQGTMIPMRDGTKLATEIFLPPGGQPTAVILVRTPYGRMGGAKYAKGMLAKKPFAFVVQDTRGDGDSQGTVPDVVDNEIEIPDGYDTIDWIAKQPWCNGKIGMFGGSGNGMCAAMAYLSKHPNLTVVNPANSANNAYLYWSFENGLRRWMYNWLSNRGPKTQEWPKPTIYDRFDPAKWQAILDNAAKDNKTVYIGDDGWFNIFGDSAVDLFEQFAKTGRLFLSVNASTHGGGNAKGVQFNIKSAPGKKTTFDFLEILGGAEPPKESILTYAVIGDCTDPSAPGNVKKVTSSWPPANTPTPFFFAPDGALQKTAPATASSVSFSYDPKNPAPTIGGGFSYGSAPNGAMDQRPLAERKDVLRFVSEPLAEPLEIAGKLRAELFISSDAPDTSFMVKFVDIYPDGQEIILREAGVLARFRDGKIASAPLEKGKTYKLAFPCNSIAAVFNKGHRIGILVTSSSTPAYEVHPNTWEPVTSMDKSAVANQTIHLGGADASRIFLPVVSSQ